MINTKELSLTKDIANRKITIVRDFEAPLELVWNAWTDSTLLDQWWAPKPWQARTKSMDFREGGHWHYLMAGPEGEGSWARVDYRAIVPHQYFTAKDAFCDSEGHTDNSFPSMDWKNSFAPAGTGTRVMVEITFDKEEDMEKILQMGFEQGFTMALGNLDELLEAQAKA